MPRIRKKTSNRGTTNQRKRILGKVKESRKKAKKAAKKNPQWKSKSPKDPGIPNNFPFKDQVLAEVSEQRRIAAEEKLRKKEEKKALRAKAKRQDTEGDGSGEEDADENVGKVEVELEELTGLQIGNDSIGGVGAKQLVNAKALKRPAVVHAEVSEDEEEDVPILINRDYPNLKAVIDKSDVVIQVLDARDPLAFRSEHLENLVSTKPLGRTLLVLNKIDTCPREAITSWTTHLRTQHPTFLFRSASAFLPLGPEPSEKVKGKGKAKVPTNDGLGVDAVLEYLGQCAQDKTGETPLLVSVLGLTNAGKSSFVNSLLRKSALPVYSLATSSRGPTTTQLPQEVTIEAGGKQIKIVDTPGLSWEAPETEDLDDIRARDILMRNKGRIDRLKDPIMALSHIVVRSNTEDLMLFYSLPAFAKNDPNSFLAGVARSQQLIKKKGELDLVGASRIVLRDWSTGRFPRYTLPFTTPAPPAIVGEHHSLAKLYSADEPVLSRLRTRKEMRKSGGLVKVIPGKIETRNANIDAEWIDLEDKDEDEDEDKMDIDVEEEEEEEEEDTEDEQDEGEDEEDVTPPISNKQKRKRTNDAPVAPPSKKVAFAPDPKGSKQARKARSLDTNPPQKETLPKSALAKPKAIKDATKKQERTVANASKKKAPNPGGDETYDFSKFF